jgi:hypothetical protein
MRDARRIAKRAASAGQRLLLALALVCFALPAAADSVSATSEGRFGRLLFTLDPIAHAKASLSGGVLTIAFDRKVAVNPNTVAQELPAYVSSGRADPDGQTFRFALSQNARVHTSASADRVAVDLAPDSFAGLTPNLPPPPPVEAQAVEIAKLPALPIRAGAYANFSRLVFDWPRNVPYTVFPGAGHITVRFEAMARPDFTSFEHVSPPWVKEAGWRVENRGTVIEFGTDSQSSYHDFRDGTKIVVDIVAPKADSAAYKPPSDSGKGATRPELIKLDQSANPAATDPQVKAIVQAAAQLNNPNKTAPVPPDQAAKNSLAATVAAPAAQTPAPAQPAQTATAPAPSTPTQAQAPVIGAPVSAQALGTHDGVIIRFPGAGNDPAAVFLRGATAWIVIVGTPKIDPVQFKAMLGNFPASFDSASGNGVTTVRIGLKQSETISARAEGANLRVDISPHVTDEPIAIGLVRDDDDPRHTMLSTLIPGAAQAITMIDPAAGDSLIVVPSLPGHAAVDARNYAEFAILATAAGLVVQPYTDDISIAVSRGRVNIIRPNGLALTSAPALSSLTPAGLVRGGNTPSFLDLAAWGSTQGRGFYDAQRRLRTNIAAQKPEDANHARLALARFYLGNQFAAEALGMINLIQTADPSLQGDTQLQTMRAAADYMMGRYREAHNELAGTAFDNDRHAAFWRGLIEAGLENWDGVHKALSIAEPVINRYPPDWQARARLAEAKAALASNAVIAANSQYDRLPRDLPRDLALEAQYIRARLYAAQGRSWDAHVIFASLIASGNERVTAESILADTETRLADDSITVDGAIATLEHLRYRWRGDALELNTLRKLGSLYFRKQRWREGLVTLKSASLNFPNDEMAREAQDDMRATFVNLFLNGKADRMPPIQALSLFYDFIDLTPIGPDGDEMIRRMADRLVAVDLLGPAESLLDYQVTKRLDGVARSQVATRLAMIDLIDHKPKDALASLRATEIAGLPDDINHERVLLEARSLAALKQWDQALDLIAVDEATDTRRLRADIYWESGNWPVAAQKSEELVGDRWSDATPLSADDRQDIMRSAIAYSLADDEASLDRLRAHFAAKMKASPDAASFAVVTQNIDMQGVAFRDLAGKIASIDTLEDFMQNFKKHFESAKHTN